nr:MAG TPA: Baseplate component [Caudoviricetes sp.]
MTTKFITLNVWNTEDIKVKVNQGEVNARFLEVQFIDKNQPLNLEDKRVFFFAKKPDGNLIFNRCEIVDENDGKINLALTSQMSIVNGIMQDCEFDIIATDLARLKVKGLILEIEKCTDFDSATESTSEFTALEEAIAGYEGASDAIDAHVANKNNPHEVTTTQIGAVPYEVKYDTDFDDMTTPGFYTMINGDNTPMYGRNFSLIVNKADTNDLIQQIAVSEFWGEVYLRQYEYGDWSPWESFSMEHHRHAASHITSGKLSIARGGTNATTASDALSNLGGVPTTRTINSKALSSNITLNASDVGAAESNHTHSTSDISSGTLPIARGGTNATTASDALSNLGGVNFSNIVQQTIYVPERPKIPSKGFNIVSFTNPFRGNTTDKILGVTSCHISGRPTAEGTGTSYSMHLVAEPQFSSSNAVGYILIYNPNTSDLYVTSDSYIVLSSVKP